jgi:hypothetical protein
MNIFAKVTPLVVAIGLLGSMLVPAFAQTDYDYSWDDSSYDTSYDYNYDTTSTMTDEEAAAFGMVWLVSMVCGGCFALVMYVYSSLALTEAAKRVGITTDLWMAWIPFANIYLMTKIANLEILHFIITIIFGFWAFYVYAKMYERRGMSPWSVLLFFIPLVGPFIGIYMLGWGGNKAPVAQPAA